jgi:uncharacterized coiled-coil protein SlyX
MPADITNIPAIITALGGLLSLGAGAWWIRSGTTVVLAQKDAAEARRRSEDNDKRTAVLESRVNQQDTIINEIRTRLAKLDRVDELVAMAKYIEEAIKQLVPRSEQETIWQAWEKRFARLESDVRSIQDHANQQS